MHLPKPPSLLAVLTAVAVFPAAGAAPVRWNDALVQPPAWYASAEALRVADNVLSYQTPEGGWPKNVDMAREPLAPQGVPHPHETNTIDNGATWTQLTYLARVYERTPEPRFQAAFERGLDYLFAAQYPNGGWPQYFPRREGYYSHVTFNDGAMISVMTLLRDVAGARPPYRFVDAGRRARAGDAVARGIECILRCQVRIDGTLTVWCAQHDEHTLAPAPARRFEPVTLSGGESAGIVRFLMQEEQPSAAVIEAVRAAVAWFEAVKLTGLRFERVTTPSGPDATVAADPAAGPLWARFYEIGTNRPVFTGRDAVVRYRLAGIERERRGGYAWYGTWPEKVLRDFPEWEKRVSGGHPAR
ncbi:MAG TPA: pectate lyase [Opitutaceae bacterium]